MNYALIKDGYVVNIIWLSPSNAQDFPGAVVLNGLPVQVGDAYSDGIFYRNGDRVLSPVEAVEAEMADMKAALALLGVTDDE